MAFRVLSRLSSGLRQGVRGLAGEEYAAAEAAEQKHAASTSKLWKKISFFVACPAMGLCAFQAYRAEIEHMSHGRPDFINYAHLRLRKTPFPWGDGNHSLFHGHNNPLPEGYEH